MIIEAYYIDDDPQLPVCPDCASPAERQRCEAADARKLDERFFEMHDDFEDGYRRERPAIDCERCGERLRGDW